MSNTSDEFEVEFTDAELLIQLREGRNEAYTELWRRHVKAALRIARIIAPGQAEDLVSESFLAVYDQVVKKGNGPEEAFRAYLFTTMRNTAMRWQRAGRLVDTEPDLDGMHLNDGLAWVEDRAEAAEMLAAFQDLPERWQRVLWLSEVEEVGRSSIAAELGIKPNAVSALLRRARTGLRHTWLLRQIPEHLRNDSGHVARDLPTLILRGKLEVSRAKLQSHLDSCRQCLDIEGQLRASYRNMRSGTLGAAGFGALGVTLPTASQTPVVIAAASVTIASVTAIAASAALMIATGTVVADLLFNSGDYAAGQDQAGQSESQEQRNDAGDSGHGGDSDKKPNDGVLDSATLADEANESSGRGTELVGRFNVDPTIPTVSFGNNSDLPENSYIPPERPTPAPEGSIPEPSDESDDDTGLRSGISTPDQMTTSIAPVLEGNSEPGASIAVEIERRPDASSGTPYLEQFVTVADAQGGWTFDLRPVIADRRGEFDYRVWAFSDSEVSPVDTGVFVLMPPSLSGFESLEPFEMMPLDEASTTGIVFSASGQPNGTICLTSVYSDQTAAFTTDSSGEATQRIRFLGGGTYYLAFRACEGEYRGPAFEVFVDVEGDPSSPYGGIPNPEDMVFELTAP